MKNNHNADVKASEVHMVYDPLPRDAFSLAILRELSKKGMLDIKSKHRRIVAFAFNIVCDDSGMESLSVYEYISETESSWEDITSLNHNYEYLYRYADDVFYDMNSSYRFPRNTDLPCWIVGDKYFAIASVLIFVVLLHLYLLTI